MRRCCRARSLLGIGPIDLVLLHAPVVGLRIEAYHELEALCSEGVCKSIGVSNYGVHHLEELLQVCKIPPAVNQIELHPFFHRRELVAFCHANGIIVQAYSPLGKGGLVQDSTILRLAALVGKSPAQVLLAWALAQVPVILPKSSRADRQRENASLDFTLPDEVMRELDGLARPNGGCTWDPTMWT